jgi:hypothetical protein
LRVNTKQFPPPPSHHPAHRQIRKLSTDTARGIRRLDAQRAYLEYGVAENPAINMKAGKRPQEFSSDQVAKMLL